MQKFILIYHGGSRPPDSAAGEKLMADWHDWVAQMGDALDDPGSPFGKSQTVLHDGSVSPDGGANPAGGYCFVLAENVEDAIAKSKTHPFLTLGGSIEVAPVMDHSD